MCCAESDGNGAIVARLRAAGCVFAEDEAQLLIAAASTPTELDGMIERRCAGLPLEQILGWAGFCGLRISVDPGVFVPRRRTEFLVEQAAAIASARPVIVDLCCGSGAVGVALASRLDTVELHASDIDPAAVACARRNVSPPGQVYQGDLYEPLPDALRGRIDLLVVNAPYVPTDEIAMMPPEARIHEARVALDGGADGLDIQRRITATAARWLAPGGHLLIETSERQAPATLAAFTGGGLLAWPTHSEARSATVIIGTSARRS